MSKNSFRINEHHVTKFCNISAAILIRISKKILKEQKNVNFSEINFPKSFL